MRKYKALIKQNPMAQVDEQIRALEGGNGPSLKKGRKISYGNDIERALIHYSERVRDSGLPLGVDTICMHLKSLLIMQGKGDIMKNYEHGQSWARRFFKRNNFVVRVPTRASGKLPTNFPEVKSLYNLRVWSAVITHNIPAALIFLPDETGKLLIPDIRRTYEVRGSTQVILVGKGDKRQMTVMLACDGLGEMIPAQMIWKGKTERCLHLCSCY